MNVKSLIRETMRAAVIDRYGQPERLQVREFPRPICGANQVLIRVRAAGINPIDWKIRQGMLRWLLPISLPLVPGFDVAGEIAAVGSGVGPKSWQVGDPVMAFLDNLSGGGYAEYAVASADVVVPKPENISFQEAAGIPLAATTALQALHDCGKLTAGQCVLINGASGGVGHFAVQIAAILGARATGVCSDDNQSFVRELGADRVLDYGRTDFTREHAAYDLVFDAVAQSTYWKCRRVLHSHGRYVSTVPNLSNLAFQAATLLARQKCATILARSKGKDLEQLAHWAASGVLHPYIEEVFPLEQVAAAHRVSERGHVRGKLVLSID